jgi:hypothetical protein
MKQYLLSVCYPAGGTPPPPEALQRIMRDVHAVNRDMQAAGAWVFSGGLHPATTATVLRQQGGGIITTDGPFIESKELLGGFIVVEVDSEATALEMARTWPGVVHDTDRVEVWPVGSSEAEAAAQAQAETGTSRDE